MNKLKQVVKIGKILFILLAILLILKVIAAVAPFFMMGVSGTAEMQNIETVLFSDTTQNGHTITIVQVGMKAISGSYHTVKIKLDGTEIIKCQLQSAQESHLYPAQDISCEVDNENTYRLIFRTRDGDCDYSEFSADFSKITKARCVEIELINDRIQATNVKERGRPNWSY